MRVIGHLGVVSRLSSKNLAVAAFENNGKIGWKYYIWPTLKSAGIVLRCSPGPRLGVLSIAKQIDGRMNIGLHGELMVFGPGLETVQPVAIKLPDGQTIILTQIHLHHPNTNPRIL